MCSGLLDFLCHYQYNAESIGFVNKIAAVHQCFVLFTALKYSFCIACIIQSTEDWPGDRQNYYKEPRISLPTTRHGEHLCVLFVAHKPVEIILCCSSWHSHVSIFFHSPNMHTLLPSFFIAQNIVSCCSDNFHCSLSIYPTFKKQCSECIGENPLCSEDFLPVFSIFWKMTIYIGKQNTLRNSEFKCTEFKFKGFCKLVVFLYVTLYCIYM